MSKGETAQLEIEPEWAYGKKGLPDSKYPLAAFCVGHVHCVHEWLITVNTSGVSLTLALPEFHQMQSSFSRSSWCLWIENMEKEALLFKG